MKKYVLWLAFTTLLAGGLVSCNKDTDKDPATSLPVRSESISIGGKTWFTKSNFVLFKSRTDSMYRLRVGALVPDYQNASLNISFLETTIPTGTKTYNVTHDLSTQSRNDEAQIRFFYPETMNFYYATSGQVIVNTVGSSREVSFNNLILYNDSNQSAVTLSYWSSIPQQKVVLVTE